MTDSLGISADFEEISMSSGSGVSISLNDLDVSDSLKLALSDWNERYQNVIQMDLASRSNHSAMIAELDTCGLVLVKRIAQESSTFRPVRYFSEGLLRYLD